MQVPYLDLTAQHRPLRQEIDAAIADVINANAFAGGPFVEKFEEDFARFCKASHCVGLGSGTDALWLALLAAGVGPGDEVITVPMTFIATAEAVTYVGATPVFVDIDPRTYTMDVTQLEAAITPRTAAIIPVHLFGQPADMQPILEIAARHEIEVIEDACQAHGAEYRHMPVGTIGKAGCFSFYPGKNLGAFGEAGALVTNNAQFARTVRILRDHGQIRKYHHQLVGWNCRMDGIQGAVLRIKLRGLQEGNNARRRHAATYRRLLGEHLVTPFEADYSRHVYHVYTIRTPQRDALMQALAKEGIGHGIHYPVPLHLQEAYAALEYGVGDFPISERCANEFLSLPMFPELTQAQLERVGSAVQSSLSALGSHAEISTK